MRLYMCIKGEYLPDPIKIRSISFDNRYLESGPPRIYIRIDRKYEECFQYDVRELKFLDKNGKVYFAAKTAWLHFRCYESDMHEDVKAPPTLNTLVMARFRSATSTKFLKMFAMRS